MKKNLYIIISIVIFILVLVGIFLITNNNPKTNNKDKNKTVIPEKKNVFKCEKQLIENSNTKKEIYEIKVDSNNNIINEKRYDQYNYKSKSDYFNKIKSLKTQNINYELDEKSQIIKAIISDGPLYNIDKKIISISKDIYISNMKASGFSCEE